MNMTIAQSQFNCPSLMHRLLQPTPGKPLGAPLDEGFNRLAWLFPYAVGATFLVGIGFVTVRWSRRDPSERAGAGSSPDGAAPALAARGREDGHNPHPRPGRRAVPRSGR